MTVSSLTVESPNPVLTSGVSSRCPLYPVEWTSDTVHNHTCTARVLVQWIHYTSARVVKKNWIFLKNWNFFFGFFPSLFHPYFFFLQKRKTLLIKALWKTLERHRIVFALARGLLYTSSRNGYQSYSEKYTHGWESVTEGGLKNLLVL